MPSRLVRWLFVLFALSGFTGLIYESVWSHYLRLFLGAAAFAQSFVLVAFMGGMALGAWLASRASAKLRNPLLAYAAIEALIGVAALLFHPLYLLLTEASLQSVLRALGSPTSVEIYKYALCVLLIVPQTILLGATFPLLSAAVIRVEPAASGHHLAMLYFTNSIGAAIGALAAAFLLLGWFGMPGTMRLAGAANLGLGAAVFWLGSQGDTHASVSRDAKTGSTRSDATLARLFLWAAFLTGAASFIYEIAWIRMLGLVLGSSFQAFELMLSAFITGLALGGLWIRRRIDAIADPVRFSGVVQLLMGLAALGTVFIYDQSFDWMAWALGVLQRNDAAYSVFNLFSHAITFAVMLPATFLAGMTLPLFTNALLRAGHGERAIGQVYAANTLGAIAGVLIAVHILLPGTGVKLALVAGAATDMLLGGLLLRYSGLPSRRRAHALAAVVIGMLAAALTARADVLRPDRLASGVYRYGAAGLSRNEEVRFYRDGKTASIAVRFAPPNLVSIVTNGKPDASVNVDLATEAAADESTMTLLGALPLLLRPDAKDIANIGLGSGLTTEVVLSHSGPRSVDTIEIEPAMAEGARFFVPRISRVFSDPRSRIFFEDAKSYFARFNKRYDVIISEPSNPWMNGVATLFTTEFYRDTKRYLAPGGLFVQWLHVYEFNDRLVASVLEALDENFADFEVYEANTSDIIIVASADGAVPRPTTMPEKERAFLEELKRVGVQNIEHIGVRSLGTKRALIPLHAPLGSPVNSDFHPFVQLESARARFVNGFAFAIRDINNAPLPLMEMSAQHRVFLKADAPFGSSLQVNTQSAARQMARLLLDPAPAAFRSAQPAVSRLALALQGNARYLCTTSPPEEAIEYMQDAAQLTLAHLAPGPRRELWVEKRWLPCPQGGASAEVRQRLQLYEAVAARDAAVMFALATRLLDGNVRAGQHAWREFLLETAMLGAQAAGHRDQALRLLVTYAPMLYPNGRIPLPILYIANMPSP